MGYFEPEKRDTRPSTVGWGLGQEGREWYNKALHSKEYWNGSEVKSVPGSSSGGIGHITDYDYCIDLDDGKAYDRTDMLVDSDSNIADLINRVVNLLPTVHARTGRVVLFSPTATIRTFNKDIIIGKRTYLDGISPESTVLQASANMTDGGIVVDSTDIAWTDWAVRNLQVNMNGKNGHCVYAAHGDQAGLACRQTLHNLRLYDSQAGFDCLRLNNVRHVDARMIRTRAGAAGAGNIKITSTPADAINRGEGIFANVLTGGFGYDNVYGLWVEGDKDPATSNEVSAGNILTFQRFHCGGVMDSYGAGTVGVKIKNDFDLLFELLHCEGQEHNVDLEGTNATGHYVDNITFLHPTLLNKGTNANQHCWHFAEKVWNVSVIGGRSQHATDGAAVYDDILGSWNKDFVQFIGHSLWRTGGAEATIVSNHNVVRFLGCMSYSTTVPAGFQEYQTQTGAAWADPAGPVWEGRDVKVYNSTIPGYRLYSYLNGAWRHADLS